MNTYPRLLRRVQAVLVDSIIIPVVLLVVLLLVNVFGVENIYVKIAALFLPLLILEPGLVSLTGGTIGHHVIGLKVVNSRTNNNINIVLASIRFIVKALLGWLSFVVVLTSKKHQAIHDYLTGSIVINKSSDGLPSEEALTERIIEESGYVYPSKMKRTLIILMYNIILFVFVIFVVDKFLSRNCLEHDLCSNSDHLLGNVISVVWMICVALLIVFGWQGKLPGGKRKNQA
ncbi:RDD family protein [Thiolapillus sp.]